MISFHVFLLRKLRSHHISVQLIVQPLLHVFPPLCCVNFTDGKKLPYEVFSLPLASAAELSQNGCQ
jgi:hypothetical protein